MAGKLSPVKEVDAHPVNKADKICDRILMAEGDNLDEILLNDAPL